MKIRAIVLSSATLLASGCVVTTEPGPKGERGPQGDPGVLDDTTASALQAAIEDLQAQLDTLQAKHDALQVKTDALQARVDATETQLEDPDCPVGYQAIAKPFLASNPDSVLCKNADDEVVRIGRGPAAFWIDRYEASIWEHPDGSGIQYGTNGMDFAATFPKNGQHTAGFKAVYAVSRSGVKPSHSLTWFQAHQACRASGKRLPNGEEWLAAASGTSDPGESDGSGAVCVTMKSGGLPRDTGEGVACVSGWGAEDMIGNLSEFTLEWYAAPGDGTDANNDKPAWGAPEYAGDGTWNLLSGASGNGANLQNVPAACHRGGSYQDGVLAGVFALNLGAAPTRGESLVGLRCVLSK